MNLQRKLPNILILFSLALFTAVTPELKAELEQNAIVALKTSATVCIKATSMALEQFTKEFDVSDARVSCKMMSYEEEGRFKNYGILIEYGTLDHHGVGNRNYESIVIKNRIEVEKVEFVENYTAKGWTYKPETTEIVEFIQPRSRATFKMAEKEPRAMTIAKDCEDQRADLPMYGLNKFECKNGEPISKCFDNEDGDYTLVAMCINKRK